MKKKLTKYTEKKHAARVLALLSHKNPCGKCPASYQFNNLERPDENWDTTSNVCGTCMMFSGLSGYPCPCSSGKDENIKRAWLKLEETGMV